MMVGGPVEHKVWRTLLPTRIEAVQIVPAFREHIPFLRNRDVLSIHALAHVLVGEPVATSPGHALAG
jgi:hypothetical protein